MFFHSYFYAVFACPERTCGEQRRTSRRAASARNRRRSNPNPRKKKEQERKRQELAFVILSAAKNLKK